MTAEPRPVEEIRADLVRFAYSPPAPLLNEPKAAMRLIRDVEPLLARLAAADRENASGPLLARLNAAERERDFAYEVRENFRATNVELRGEVERLTAKNQELPDYATNESALVTIIRVISETYTDAGVLLWLNAKNRHLRSKPDGNHRCTPAEYIAAGYAAEVLEAARRIEGSL